MTFLLWVGLYPIIFVSWTSGALLSSDPVLMFAKEGDRVILPCGLSVGSCSSMNWTEKFLAWENELVTAGKVTDSNEKKYHLLKDCSLEISHMERNYATMYYCKHGEQNWGVFLQIIDINESQTAAEDTIELHCSLSRYTGYVPCNDTRIHINWTTAGDVPITGKRFRFENPSVCFSKLIITKKITDHHRTWKCQVVLNEEVKATASYETRVKEGLEEVFTPVGESVSLLCRNTSSLRLGDSLVWALNKKTLANMLVEKNHVSKDSSLVISKLSPLHAGDYQCMASSEERIVFHKIRLHTLDVLADTDPAGGNLTLTCVLTCAKECEENFNLSWSGSNQEDWRGRLLNVNNTLLNKLRLSVWPDEITCSVYREGSLMASKSWHSVKSKQILTWMGLLLGLLMCAVTGGLFIYFKRNKDPCTESGSGTPPLNFPFWIM
ncbi:PREDICTED: uncharacterized protein LOC107102533 isoform X1 [Cyprinodon variegatus]|uniref:uncharacterized protein LOC107102533 isoform X1 n=1 Tax=Cyprinodon variegatus TaxID=28743 RepID=UPI000742CBA2|nr:PREDICTED: uncharacterized protein LOC107102533 isoform X1 [Cyprinodon variegatus]